MTRWKASAIHLLICATIGMCVISAMLFAWYPQPYFDALGGGKLAFILLGVDVVLGPLITLVIFKAGKKGLKFDLAVIALVQLSALAYGLHVVFEARPVYIVFSVDRFDLVAANEVVPDAVTGAPREEFKSLPLTGPLIVAADLPEDKEARTKVMFSSLSGVDIQHLPQYYVPYQERTAVVLSKAKSLAKLRERRADAAERFTQLEQELGVRTNELMYLPLVTKKVDLTAVIDPASGRIMKVLPVDPWV